MRSFIIIFSGMLALATGQGAYAVPRDERSWQEIQAYLTQSLGCRWLGSDAEVVCPLPKMGGNIDLHRDAGAKEPDVIEINPVVVNHRAGPGAEKYGREATLKALRYVLPGWKEGPAWLRQALIAAKQRGDRRITNVGRFTVLVQHLQPADLEDTYALVVITTRRSLSDWDPSE